MVAQNGQKVFGAGRFYGIPTVTAPTPSVFGVVQDMSLDFKRDIKRLHGLNQFPVDVASGMMTVTGKVNMGTLNGRLVNDLLMGGSMSTGQIPWIANESATVAGSSLASGTFTAANGAGFQTDLGLYAYVTGVPLVRVTTGLITSSGQYSVSTAGLYTISSLDGNIAARVSYLYSTSGGQQTSMTNQPMGKIGNFQAVMDMLWTNLAGTQEKTTIQLNNCMASDYSLATKLDDYTKPGFGFDAATDANDVLGIISYAEVN